MSGGKTSSQEQKIELPEEIEDQAKKNIELANQIGSLPYAPNFGATAAAFSPTQEASFANTNAAAQAFGLPASSGTGLPAAQDFGGYKGYSTQPLYEDSMGRVPDDIKGMYNSFFQGFGQDTGNEAASSDAGKGGQDIGWLIPGTNANGNAYTPQGQQPQQQASFGGGK